MALYTIIPLYLTKELGFEIEYANTIFMGGKLRAKPPQTQSGKWRGQRAIACAPVPARGDKRFRQWNPQLIYPPDHFGDDFLNHRSR